MRLGRLPIAFFAAVLAGVTCAQAATAPRVVTLRDSGKTLTARKGVHLELRLPESERWVGPRVLGDAVRLTRIEFFRDPGYLAWSVVAVARGTARVTAVGYGESSRSCDPGPCAPRLLRVTFVVR
jgi:hypothetical protein